MNNSTDPTSNSETRNSIFHILCICRPIKPKNVVPPSRKLHNPYCHSLQHCAPKLFFCKQLRLVVNGLIKVDLEMAISRF